MISFASSIRMLVPVLATLALFLPDRARAEDTPLPPHSLVGDSLGLSKGRSDGAPLKNATSEIGQVPWTGTDGLVFSANGGVTANITTATMAVVPVAPSMTKILRAQADVNPQGSGFASVVLLADSDLAGFWKKATLWAYLGPSGNWGVYSDGTTNVLGKGSVATTGFQLSGFNHLELIYNPTSQKVSLNVNGVKVLKDVPVVTAPSTITEAGIRFNEPVIANQPLIKNFAVDELDAEP